MAERLSGLTFAKVFTSPLHRAMRTCELASASVAEIERDLLEWDYGEYEGRLTVDKLKERPDWQLFRDGCLGGESPQQVAERAGRVVARVRAVAGDRHRNNQWQIPHAGHGKPERGGIRRVSKVIEHVKPECELGVDGGIDEATAPLVAAAGANVLVAGSSIFATNERVGAAMETLRAAIAHVKH